MYRIETQFSVVKSLVRENENDFTKDMYLMWNGNEFNILFITQ